MTADVIDGVRASGISALFPVAETEPVLTNPAALGFHARFEAGDRIVRFGGPDFQAEAELIRGDLDGLIGTGLLALGKPSGKMAKVQNRGRWAVSMPPRTRYKPAAGARFNHEKDSYRNIDRLRRVITISGPEVAVLRFDREIPRVLWLALKLIFEGPSRCHKVSYLRQNGAVLPSFQLSRRENDHEEALDLEGRKSAPADGFE